MKCCVDCEDDGGVALESSYWAGVSVVSFHNVGNRTVKCGAMAITAQAQTERIQGGDWWKIWKLFFENG